MDIRGSLFKTQGYLTPFPADPGTNNIKTYILKSAVRKINFL